MTPAEKLKQDADAKVAAAQKLLAEAAAEKKQASAIPAPTKPEPVIKVQPSVFETMMAVVARMKGTK